ncbi:MAG TPA: DMT family transporter [Trichocoleus sp.]|jgi:drug/metabolite transporter (DMT)-like permease
MSLSASQNHTIQPIDWVLILLLSVIWGGSFFFIKIALADFQPLTIVWGRVTIAAILLTIWVYLSGQKMPRSAQLWREFSVMGLLNNLIPFCLIVWAETQIDSSLAAIVNATTPIFTVILANFLTQDEKLTLNRSIGIGLGICGVVVLVGFSVLRGLSLHDLGQFASLAASFSYGCASVYGRRFKTVPSLVTAAGTVTTASLLLLPIAFWVEKPWTVQPRLSAVAALIVLGLVCTGVAYFLYFSILGRVGATYVSLVTFLVPISALLLGILILGERLALNSIVGMALIFAGLAAIDGRFFRKA